MSKAECRNKVPEVGKCQITQCSIGHVMILDFILRMVGELYLISTKKKRIYLVITDCKGQKQKKGDQLINYGSITRKI